MSLARQEATSSLIIERHGPVAVVTLNRSHKRNALDDWTIQDLGSFFGAPPAWAKVGIIAAAGTHFSAGLDLNALTDGDAVAGLHHSRRWHDAFRNIESGAIPVIAVLKGAVIGGGLELAASTHLRIAEDSTFFALPEAQRGLFVGGGGSVRVPKLIGAHRVVDMMLTGRVLDADEGARAGLAHYRVPDGAGLDKAHELAGKIVENSPVSNFAVIHALPRIAEASPETGLLLESLMSAVAQSSPDAKDRLNMFLDGRAAKVVTRGDR